jgi:hypothetical protein
LTGYVACKGNTDRTSRAGETVQTSLRGIANKARTDRKHRFQNLFGLIDKEWLLDSWRYINKHAARGVDKVSAGEYEENLDGTGRTPKSSTTHYEKDWESSVWKWRQRKPR